MAVVVDVSLTQVLVFGILVRQVGVSDRRVVVLMRVQCSQVFPLADELIRPFPPVVSHVRMLVRVNQRLVAVLNVLRQMCPLSNLIQNTPRGRQGASHQYGNRSNQAQEYRSANCSLHRIPSSVHASRFRGQDFMVGTKLLGSRRHSFNRATVAREAR
jgi:hypothetical protein